MAASSVVERSFVEKKEDEPKIRMTLVWYTPVLSGAFVQFPAVLQNPVVVSIQSFVVCADTSCVNKSGARTSTMKKIGQRQAAQAIKCGTARWPFHPSMEGFFTKM